MHELHYLLRGVMVLCAAAALIILNRPLLDWIDRREIEHVQANPTDRGFPVSLAVYIATALVIGLIVILALAFPPRIQPSPREAHYSYN